MWIFQICRKCLKVIGATSCDMKQGPHKGPTNIRCHGTTFHHLGFVPLWSKQIIYNWVIFISYLEQECVYIAQFVTRTSVLFTFCINVSTYKEFWWEADVVPWILSRHVLARWRTNDISIILCCFGIYNNTE